MAKKSMSDYDVKKFREFVEPFLEKRNESYRQASMSAGLDETAISRYFRGTQPVRDACIALADHFDVNPNEMLKAAGYEPLHFFDRRLIDPNAMPPDIEQLVAEIMKIENKSVRQEMVETLHQVLQVQMSMREDALERAMQQMRQEGDSPVSEAVST